MPVYQDKDKNGKIIKTKDGRSWYFKVYKNGKACKSKRYLTKREAKDEEAVFLLKRDLSPGFDKRNCSIGSGYPADPLFPGGDHRGAGPRCGAD